MRYQGVLRAPCYSLGWGEFMNYVVAFDEQNQSAPDPTAELHDPLVHSFPPSPSCILA